MMSLTHSGVDSKLVDGVWVVCKHVGVGKVLLSNKSGSIAQSLERITLRKLSTAFGSWNPTLDFQIDGPPSPRFA